MSEPKTYIPGLFIRERETPFGPVLQMDFDAKQIALFAQNMQNDRGRLKIVVASKSTPDKYGTHTAWLDTWKPDSSRQSAPRQPAQRELPTRADVPKVRATPEDEDSGIPF